ncbi:Phage protein [Kosakonia radicincitans]|uniref:hypothetical protein n=1 Tax=Kosakonia radicincitans TaxID=283686 RepID=UPI001184419E|nr:hypothetical protein [Kosakonia radicincitans]VVT52225.1 Phage protein [Kosakonia radicincitans]
MKKGWFHHTDLTDSQAKGLVARYTARGVETSKSLSPDYLSWIVSAYLPEGKPSRSGDSKFRRHS